MIELWYKYIIN